MLPGGLISFRYLHMRRSASSWGRKRIGPRWWLSLSVRRSMPVPAWATEQCRSQPVVSRQYARVRALLPAADWQVLPALPLWTGYPARLRLRHC